MKNPNQSGMLYIVATPIGNLADITLRALEILAAVDVIACEDTRHSQTLLSHYQINTPLMSLHAFNESKRVDLLLARLLAGEHVALISDAGTPLISDPGYQLVVAARRAGIQVSPIPGCCALIAALCAAGLPTDNFLFVGFLSNKGAERKRRLISLQMQTETLIFYEAPHRILKLLQEITEVFSDNRHVTLVKELTKTFETFFSGNATEVYHWLQADPYHQKGEFVVLVSGTVPEKNNEITQEAERILTLLSTELSSKQAVELTEKITGVKKNLLKSVMLRNKNIKNL